MFNIFYGLSFLIRKIKFLGIFDTAGTQKNQFSLWQYGSCQAQNI